MDIYPDTNLDNANRLVTGLKNQSLVDKLLAICKEIGIDYVNLKMFKELPDNSVIFIQDHYEYGVLKSNFSSSLLVSEDQDINKFTKENLLELTSEGRSKVTLNFGPLGDVEFLVDCSSSSIYLISANCRVYDNLDWEQRFCSFEGFHILGYNKYIDVDLRPLAVGHVDEVLCSGLSRSGEKVAFIGSQQLGYEIVRDSVGEDYARAFEPLGRWSELLKQNERILSEAASALGYKIQFLPLSMLGPQSNIMNSQLQLNANKSEFHSDSFFGILDMVYGTEYQSIRRRKSKLKFRDLYPRIERASIRNRRIVEEFDHLGLFCFFSNPLNSVFLNEHVLVGDFLDGVDVKATSMMFEGGFDIEMTKTAALGLKEWTSKVLSDNNFLVHWVPSHNLESKLSGIHCASIVQRTNSLIK